MTRLPDSGSSWPRMTRSSVVLPAPLGPTRAMRSPGARTQFRSSNSTRCATEYLRFWSWITGAADRSGRQALGVQPLEVGRHEAAVLAHELTVETDLAATVLGTLDEHEVPVELERLPLSAMSYACPGV